MEKICFNVLAWEEGKTDVHELCGDRQKNCKEKEADAADAGGGGGQGKSESALSFQHWTGTFHSFDRRPDADYKRASDDARRGTARSGAGFPGGACGPPLGRSGCADSAAAGAGAQLYRVAEGAGGMKFPDSFPGSGDTP